MPWFFEKNPLFDHPHVFFSFARRLLSLVFLLTLLSFFITIHLQGSVVFNNSLLFFLSYSTEKLLLNMSEDAMMPFIDVDSKKNGVSLNK